MKEKWHKKAQFELDKYESPMNLESAWYALEARRKSKKRRRFLIFFFFCGLTIFAGHLIEVIAYSKLGAKVKMDADLSETEMPKMIGAVEKANKNIKRKNASQGLLLNESADKYKKRDLIKLNKNTSPVSANSLAKSDIKRQYVVNSEYGASILDMQNLMNDSITTNRETIANNDQLDIKYEPFTILQLLSLNLKKVSLNKKDEIVEDLINDYPIFEKPNLEHKSAPLATTSKKNSIGFASSYSFITSGRIHNRESPLDAYSLLLFYEKPVWKQFYLKTGIAYQQFTSQIKIIDEETYFEIEENVLITRNHFQNGNIEELRGDVEVEYKATKYFKFYNRYSFVTIPFLVGYNIRLANKSNLKIECGNSFSVFSTHSGSVIKDDLVYSFESVTGYQSKQVGVLKGLGGLYYNRNLGKRSTLFFGGQFTYQLNTAVALEGENEGNFSSFGLVLGGRFSL